MESNMYGNWEWIEIEGLVSLERIEIKFLEILPYFCAMEKLGISKMHVVSCKY